MSTIADLSHQLELARGTAQEQEATLVHLALQSDTKTEVGSEGLLWVYINQHHAQEIEGMARLLEAANVNRKEQSQA